MIISNFKINYPYDPQRAYDFSPYADELKDITIYYGFGPITKVNDNTFKVRFNVENPNFLYLTDDSIGINIDEDNTYFDMVLTICPYTCSLLNEKYNTDKYITTFFPLKELEYNEGDRPYPIFYSGHNMYNLDIFSNIERVMIDYLSIDTYNNLRNQISPQNIDSYFRKLQIYSQTKICIAHNLLGTGIPNMSSFWNDELYKKHLPWHNGSGHHVPQIKTRMFEGAMMGCILLIYKDEFNITDMYFTENEDFLYYTDETDLRNKIDMILANYNSYKYLAENAKKKFYAKYTFRHFIDLIKAEYTKRRAIRL